MWGEVLIVMVLAAARVPFRSDWPSGVRDCRADPQWAPTRGMTQAEVGRLDERLELSLHPFCCIQP